MRRSLYSHHLPPTLFIAAFVLGCASPHHRQDHEEDAGTGAPTCSWLHSLSGMVAGKDVALPGYDAETNWYGGDPEKSKLDAIETQQMKQMGLDPESPADQDRFRYLFRGYELSLLYSEQEDFKTERELEFYFYDLQASGVKPGQKIEVFDGSSIEALRDAKQTTALGAQLRTLIDEMRSNGHADVVIAFSPDRSKEGDRAWTINLFGTNTRFATSGEAWFDHVYQGASELEPFTYPITRDGAVSVHASAAFAAGESLKLEAECLDFTFRKTDR